VAIARKMLAKEMLVHRADPDRLARKFLEFAYSMEKEQRGKSAQEFVRERSLSVSEIMTILIHFHQSH